PGGPSTAPATAVSRRSRGPVTGSVPRHVSSGQARRPEGPEDERDEEERGRPDREVDGHLAATGDAAETGAELLVRVPHRARRLRREELAARLVRDRAQRLRVGRERLAQPGAAAEHAAAERAPAAEVEVRDPPAQRPERDGEHGDTGTF